MIKKFKSLKDGFEVLKNNQIILLISAIYSFVSTSFIYSLNITLPTLISIPNTRIFIFLILLFTLFCCAYFFERFLVALMIKVSSEKKKNLEKIFRQIEKIAGNFIVASFIYFCLGAITLLISQILAPVELFIFIIVVLIISIKVALYEYTIVIDDAGVKESFIISWKLTEGNWIGVFLLKSFFFAIYILVSSIFYFISNFVYYQINFYLITFLLLLFLRPWEISTFCFVFKNLKKEKKNR